MNIRSLAMVSGLVILSTAPLTAHADGAAKAADACIQAFVDTYLPKDRPINVHKARSLQGLVNPHERTHTLELSARTEPSGKQLATARCVANDKGEVIVLEGTPTANEVAALR